ncbi:hypothetical protein, partial [Flavobacterium sp.]|uniref:hypothetical protein n=1 Tax=Flavobacterium sp. TaxID=239 RepID=UPI000EBF81CE
MKKLFIFLSLFLFLTSCENNDDTTTVQNENSVKKHFVTIEQIKQIVENKPFQDFLSKFKNNEI